MKKNEVKAEKTYIEGVRINFLYVDKYSFGRAWYMPESKIPYSMLRYIISGKAIFFINGKELTVEKIKWYIFHEVVNYLVMHWVILFHL